MVLQWRQVLRGTIRNSSNIGSTANTRPKLEIAWSLGRLSKHHATNAAFAIPSVPNTRR